MADAQTFLGPLTLETGSHDRGKGMCAMEAAAYLAGEEHSDAPVCVSPVIASFMRRWNDRLATDYRQRLKPLVVQVLHTATGKADDLVRAWLCVDWLVRDATPRWLDAAKLTDHATKLRVLEPITDKARMDAARPVIKAARSAAAYAYAAAADAAYAYAAYAAYAADAAYAAYAADAYAAYAADAAYAAYAADAAEPADAADAADAPRWREVREASFLSAYELVERMIAVGVTKEAAGERLAETDLKYQAGVTHPLSTKYGL